VASRIINISKQSPSNDSTMNVLVYSGTEILPLSLTNVLASLRTILFPHYTVQTITQSSLTSQPWRISCALIVLPQFQKHYSGLSIVANKKIGEFVEAGGKCLIFGAKAHIRSRSSNGLDFRIRCMTIGSEEKEALAIPLKFYDKENNCHVAFVKDDEHDRSREDDNPHIATLITSDRVNLRCFHETGNGNLVGFDDLKNISVLARHESAEREELDCLACLSMKISEGQLTLMSPSIEYPLTQDPVRPFFTAFSSDDLQSFESSRTGFLKHVLQDIGLNIPNDGLSLLSFHSLPQLLSSAPHCSFSLSKAIRTTFKLSQDMKGVHKDVNDDFQFHSFDRQHSLELLASTRKNEDPAGDTPDRLKHIVVCGDGILPDRQITPQFDLGAYYETLCYLRENSRLKRSKESTWGIGEAVLYGEVVTSTQTMFDK